MFDHLAQAVGRPSHCDVGHLAERIAFKLSKRYDVACYHRHMTSLEQTLAGHGRKTWLRSMPVASTLHSSATTGSVARPPARH